MFYQIEDLCYRLQQDVRQFSSNLTPISIIKPSSTTNRDELDQSFMYSQLLKEIILDMPYDDKAKKEYADFCRIQYAGNHQRIEVIDEFEETYQPSLSIWWYTRETFIYSTLNKALRNQDTEIVIKMGFFLRDLHCQIEQLYSKMKNHDRLNVFRGQGVSLIEFDKIKNSKGGLLSFNNFLSTSADKDVGYTFADSARQNPDLVGIRFKIEIDSSVPTAPFTSLAEYSYYRDNENEILFSMHTVFRIVDMQEIEDRLWEINLIVTNDDDPLLTNLTKYIRDEINGSTALHRMGQLMIKMGKFVKAEEFYNILLDQTSEDDHENIAHLNHQLGIIKQQNGDLSNALEFFLKAFKIMKQHLSPNYPDLAIVYHNIGLVYRGLGEYPKALSYYEKALEIEQKSLSSDDPKLAATYCNIGLLYNDMGQYSMALSYYDKACEIQQKSLPLYHPFLSTTYNNIALAHKEMGNYEEALSYYEKTLELQHKSLPTDHPLLATTYCNIGSVLNLMGKYSEALNYHNKTLEIELKSLSSNHPSLATTYCSIGLLYHEMGQYSLALTNYEKALEIQRKSLPSNHQDLANTYNHIGLTYDQKDEYSKALSYYEMSLEIQQQSVSSNNPLLATTFNNIGSVYASRQNYSDSLSYYKKALKIRLTCLPSNHPDLAKLKISTIIVNEKKLLSGDASMPLSNPQTINRKNRMSFESIRLWFRLFIVNDLAPVVFLFLWLAINIALFIGEFLNYHHSRSYFYLRSLIFDGLSIARAAGLCLNFNCLLILLPVCRNLLSLIRYILPQCITQSRFRRFTKRLFDQHIGFHRCIGYAICFWSILHVGAHIYNYERLIDVHNEYQSLSSALNLLYLQSSESQINPFDRINSNSLHIGTMLRTTAGITGVILCICLMIIFSSSTSLIRRSFYEIFWFAHHLFIIFFICLILHGFQGIVKSQINLNEHNPEICASLYREWGINQQCLIYPRFSSSKATSWIWLCAPLCLYILERFLRFIRSLQHVEIINIIRHESNVIEIRFRKKFMSTPQPGQYIYLKCFSLSIFEWHPFTVTSAAEETYISVHIRTIGNWTNDLAQKFQMYPQDIPRLAVDGPYGSAADDVFNYDGVILIGAGIGEIERDFRDRINFLTYNIYLTKWSIGQARAVIRNNTDERDIWTGLESKTHYGRPNFNIDFQDIINEDWQMTQKRHIGVFVCGQKPLVKELQCLCIKINDHNSSKNRVRFYLNKENF
ncbi:unnamed protein product [Rotaria sordida]|uniref:FAD-binding FR-type domain-containing protein n=1 Tax=Rotaria sordida TaxID=392033 RepID=A0A814Q8G4_9BILA|nr:unnamed protein product [Rotaria sordida]